MSILEESIEEQIKNVEEEKRKLDLLQSFDINAAITERYFHKLCLTPLRYNQDVMCDIVQKIFPMATDIKWHCNYISCTIKGFDIYIPTAICNVIEVKINYITEKPKDDYFEKIEKDKNIKFLREYINLIDTKASWYKKAKLRNNANYRNWFLFFWWFFNIVPKDKKEKRNKKYYEDILEQRLKSKKEYYYKALDRYQEDISKWEVFFDEVEPILKQFTNKVIEFNSIGGVRTGYLEDLREKVEGNRNSQS